MYRTNSALGRSPLYKYNVPVNIFTTVTFSSFATFFPFEDTFFFMGSSGNSTASPEPRVERVTMRVLVLEEVALEFMDFDVVVVVFFFLDAVVVPVTSDS